jgi:type VI secretion system protein ImpH
VRLRSSPALNFAPGSLAEVVAIEGGRWQVDVRFLSLFGPNGALPLHLTEYAWDRLHNHRDPSLARFADIFHHRMLLYFYRAWAQANPAVSYDREEEDEFAQQLGSLGGYGFKSLNGRDHVPDNAKLFYTGLLARHVRSAECGAQILADYFGLAVKIEQMEPAWIDLPVEQRTRLATQGDASCLGVGTVAGARVPDCQSHYLVRIGPMPLERFQGFLPDSEGAKTLADWLRHYFGDAYSWRAQIVLQREEVPRPCIGINMLLGWQFWLGEYSLERDADDLQLPGTSEAIT